MDDLISRLRAYIAQREKIRDGGDTVTECNGEPLTLTDLREAAAALEMAQEGVKAVGTVLGGEFHYLRPSHGLPDGTTLYAIDQEDEK